MADPYRKVRSGEKFSMPAQAYNAFIDAARAHRESTLGGDAKATHRQSTVIKVRNTTGNDLTRFSIVGLSAPLITPADNLDEFKRQVTFSGVTPTRSGHNGRFAVLLEPLASGAIGIAVAAGVVVVRLLVNPPRFYDYAEVVDGTTGLLRNVPAGPARVLWIDSGDITDNPRWAVVRIDEGDLQAHVFVLSNIPDTQGLYPGVVQRFDVNTGWVSLFPCRVMDINR